jgi:hypothetical protein
MDRHRRLRTAFAAGIKAARGGGIAIVGDGDASDVDDVLENYRWWRQKYGKEEWSPLPADEVYRQLEEIAEPARAGLEPIRRGLFGRQVHPDIIQLLRFQPYKGYSYGFVWGVSLAFVPHEFERRLRFHSTLKSADLDLFEDAADVFERRGETERRGFVPAGYGADVFRHDATDAWEFVKPRLSEWWKSTTTVGGVLERVAEQIAHPPGRARHWPAPELVQACALARVGRIEEAKESLAEWLQRPGESIGSQTAANLASALEKVGSGSR